MSTLKSCPHCESLNPSAHPHCLNCEQPLGGEPPPERDRPRARLLGRVLKGASAVAMSMTLAACYGGGYYCGPSESCDFDWSGLDQRAESSDGALDGTLERSPDAARDGTAPEEDLEPSGDGSMGDDANTP